MALFFFQYLRCETAFEAVGMKQAGHSFAIVNASFLNELNSSRSYTRYLS